jgi:SH3 domain-containing YSC84-like protein 1
MNRRFRTMMAVLVVLLALGFTFVAPAFADPASEARELVEKSKLTFENFMAAKDLEGFRSLLRGAQGVFISPQLLQGAFVFGVSGGSGVLVSRDPKGGTWNGPAFYTLGEASIGLQAGGQASQVVMLALTERGVTALLSPSIKLGADVGVAAGPVGVGAEAATANISADIVAYSLSKGLYGGVSLTGAVVAVRNDWNGAYYSKPGVTPSDILIGETVTNPHAAPLLQAVTKAASGSGEMQTGRHHVVEKGDTLSGISTKYGVSVSELRRLNNIAEGEYIYPGQKILLGPSK